MLEPEGGALGNPGVPYSLTSQHTINQNTVLYGSWSGYCIGLPVGSEELQPIQKGERGKMHREVTRQYSCGVLIEHNEAQFS
jgi:hypothetical protein